MEEKSPAGVNFSNSPRNLRLPGKHSGSKQLENINPINPAQQFLSRIVPALSRSTKAPVSCVNHKWFIYNFNCTCSSSKQSFSKYPADLPPLHLRSLTHNLPTFSPSFHIFKVAVETDINNRSEGLIRFDDDEMMMSSSCRDLLGGLRQLESCNYGEEHEPRSGNEAVLSWLLVMDVRIDVICVICAGGGDP